MYRPAGPIPAEATRYQTVNFARMPLAAAPHDHFTLLLKAADRDGAWKGEWAARNLRRLTVAPQLLAFLEQLRAGEIALLEFRETFDVKTRTDWEGFGLKGLSGAMFLNKLVMHIPDQVAVRRELLKALVVPRTVDSAREQLAEFLRFLEGIVSTGAVSRMKLQPGRAPFFVTVWWHLQDREQWPAYYQSARAGLAEAGLFSESGDSVADYFSFRTQWTEVAREFGLDSWALEALLSHAHRPIEVIAPPIPPAEPARIEPVTLTTTEGAPKHTEAQWMLAEIGRKLGLKVWIASNDQNRAWNGQRLGDLSIGELPNLGIGEDAQRIVNLIDVLWLRGNNQLVCAFEIESSTSIYSGVLRMSDLSTTCPNLSFPCYIALPAEREQEVVRQLSRPTFQALEVHRRCGYFTLENLKAELRAILRWANDADCIRQLAKWVEDAR
jgi:hypothetical protein